MDKYRETKNKYDNEHMKRYSVNMPMDVYNKMMEEVEKNNTNKNAYTIQAIKEKIMKDNMVKTIRPIKRIKVHNRNLVAKAIPKREKVEVEE